MLSAATAAAAAAAAVASKDHHHHHLGTGGEGGSGMLNAGFPFVTPTIPGTNVPMFPPMMDMSSTQALLQIVRTSQLDAFVSGRTAGGGAKRPCSASSSSSSSSPQVQLLYPPHGSGAAAVAAAAAAAEQNPLDLSSSAAPCKKPRKGGFWDATTAAGSFAETFLNMPAAFGLQALHKSRDRVGLLTNGGAGGGVKRLGSTSPKPATKTAAKQSCQAAPNRVLPCASSCAPVAPSSDKSAAAACPNSADKSTVAAWTVDDVCDFVSSIDLCAEYSQVSTRVLYLGTPMP